MRLSPVCRLGVVLTLPVVIALMATGCGGKGNSKVSGKINYKGEPVKGGTVTFVFNDSKKSITADIAEDGSYVIEGLPTGEAKVVVETTSIGKKASLPVNKAPDGQSAPGARKGVDPEEAKRRYTPIPSAYESIETTQLTYTVKSGTQDYPITLEGSVTPSKTGVGTYGNYMKGGSGSGPPIMGGSAGGPPQ